MKFFGIALSHQIQKGAFLGASSSKYRLIFFALSNFWHYYYSLTRFYSVFFFVSFCFKKKLQRCKTGNIEKRNRFGSTIIALSD